jgi:hypothetical protein
MTKADRTQERKLSRPLASDRRKERKPRARLGAGLSRRVRADCLEDPRSPGPQYRQDLTDATPRCAKPSIDPTQTQDGRVG